MMVNILVTFAVVAFMVFVLAKKLYPHTVLMLLSIVILLVHSSITKVSVLGNAATGNMYIDVFQYVVDQFIATFRTNGMLIMTVTGYAGYMKKIKASDMLAALLANPMQKLKSPYLVCALTIVLSELIHVALPSSGGTAAVVMGAFFPVLLASGVNRVTAASTVVIGTAIDFGPASLSYALFVPMAGENYSMMDAFKAQVLIYPIAIVCLAVVASLYYKYMDKKENLQPETDSSKVVNVKELGVPVFYGFLPLIPIILVIVFSDLVLKTVMVSVPAAVFISYLAVVIIDAIRTKDLLGSVANTKELYQSGAKAYGDVVTLISVATVFGAAIRLIGGMDLFASFIAGLGMPAIISFMVFGLLTQVVVFATTSSNAAIATLGPTIVSLCKSFGIEPLMGGMTLVTASSCARSIAPINSSNIIVSGGANVNVMLLVKRNLVPTIAIVPIICVLGQILFHY
jgi:DcuC family C4-dicarboxylate transporter